MRMAIIPSLRLFTVALCYTFEQKEFVDLLWLNLRSCNRYYLSIFIIILGPLIYSTFAQIKEFHVFGLIANKDSVHLFVFIFIWIVYLVTIGISWIFKEPSPIRVIRQSQMAKLEEIEHDPRKKFTLYSSFCLFFIAAVTTFSIITYY